MTLKTYRNLDVWQKAMDLVLAIYELTRAFPEDEKYGLSSQIKRSAVSIPANIAEGYARSHRKEYIQHVSIAKGSLAELETHLTIAARLKFVKREDTVETWKLAQEVGRMLNGLIASLRKDRS